MGIHYRLTLSAVPLTCSETFSVVVLVESGVIACLTSVVASNLLENYSDIWKSMQAHYLDGVNQT